MAEQKTFEERIQTIHEDAVERNQEKQQAEKKTEQESQSRIMEKRAFLSGLMSRIFEPTISSFVREIPSASGPDITEVSDVQTKSRVTFTVTPPGSLDRYEINTDLTYDGVMVAAAYSTTRENPKQVARTAERFSFSPDDPAYSDTVIKSNHESKIESQYRQLCQCID